MTITKSKTARIAAAPNVLPAVELLPVGQIISARAAMNLWAVGVPRSRQKLELNRLQPRTVEHAVGPGNDGDLLHNARIDFAQRRIEIDARRNPVRAVRRQAAYATAANTRVVNDRITPLHA